MEKDRKFVLPLLTTLWPCVVIIMAMIAVLPESDIVSEMLMKILTGVIFPVAIAFFIVGFVIAGQYKKLGQYYKLAFWGMFQKLAYVPNVIVLVSMIISWESWQVPESGSSALPGGEVLAVAVLGMGMIMISGILILYMLSILIVSANYTIRAVNLLYHQGRIGKAARVLLILGNLVPIIDIFCAIAVFVIARKLKKIKKSC